MKSPKSTHKPSFKQILRSVSLLNVRNLIDKAELATALAWHYPQHGEVLCRIEKSARSQFEAILGLTFGTAAAWINRV